MEQIRTSLSLAGAILDKGSQRYPENPLHNIIYASSPTSTGLLLYETIRANPDRPISEIKKQVMGANIAGGIQLGRELTELGFRNVIVPGKFFAEGWTQEHYMSLWEQVIRRFATVICFNDGWHYSTGCVEEFLIGIQTDKEIVDRNLQPIRPHDELDKIKTAIDRIDEMELEPGRLFDVYRRAALYIESLPVVYTYSTGLAQLLPNQLG